MIGFTILLATVAGSFVLIFVLRKPPAQNLTDWLNKNHFVLLNQERRGFQESPFQYLSTSRDDNFYRIKVQTETGAIKTGWMRVSGKFSALLGQPVDVIWDAQPKTTEQPAV